MTINTNNNANIAYNYQKVPGLVISNQSQSTLGLTIAMRDDPNINRNVMFLIPVNLSTPNYGAGSPTLGAYTNTTVMGEDFYVGRQVSY